MKSRTLFGTREDKDKEVYVSVGEIGVRKGQRVRGNYYELVRSGVLPF